MKRVIVAAGLALAALTASAAERMLVTVRHDLKAARPAETITVPWAEVARRLPGALLQQLAVRDAKGKVLPYQVTNVAPQARDPKGEGIAYGELIFRRRWRRPFPSRLLPVMGPSAWTTSPGRTTGLRTAPTAPRWPSRRRRAATKRCW
jgi:hypothetical protein